jgi:DNA-binding transcriptional regulator YhcF (GntR family)
VFGQKRKPKNPEFVGFSEPVKRALSFAREEAARAGHDSVGTEHQLLGLLRENDRTLGELLERLGVDAEELRGSVALVVQPGRPSAVPMESLPYGSRAKKALEFAMAEGRAVGDSVFSPAHLLIALLREGSGIAAEALRQQGITTDKARAAIQELRGSGSHRPFEVQVDDASGESIYEQITAQIQEAVATGKLLPGDRLPPVRALADRLGIAPGTVGRAYGELERLGMVITQGARGTRVAEHKRPLVSDVERPETLVGLFRPLVVAAFHLGASAGELHNALDEAMTDIFGRESKPAS